MLRLKVLIYCIKMIIYDEKKNVLKNFRKFISCVGICYMVIII